MLELRLPSKHIYLRLHLVVEFSSLFNLMFSKTVATYAQFHIYLIGAL